MHITLTIDLTAENLEKLKVFCEETGAAPEKKPTAKQKPAGTAKAEPKKEPKAADAPAKEAPAKEEPAAKAITLQDVRAVALKFSKAGKSDVLKEIFAKFDATKLSEVPEDRYNELMEELEAANA